MGLNVQHVQKSFSSRNGKLSILKDISFSAEAGQSVSIMGPSGSGKSTLISMLAGLDTPDAGSVMIDGVNLTQLHGHRLNRFRAEKVGLVFQQFHLIDHLNALDNVRLALQFKSRNDAEDKARKCLSQLGLGDRLDHFPQQLSRGECQRLAIARVLVGSPSLVLADEPTGSLDLQNAESVFSALLTSTRAAGSVFILVTHDGSLGAKCDIRLRLVDGKLERQA